jgi:hypothetical protein
MPALCKYPFSTKQIKISLYDFSSFCNTNYRLLKQCKKQQRHYSER